MKERLIKQRKFYLLSKNISGHYKLTQRPIKRFSLLIDSQDAKVVAPLSPTLGQYGLSCQEFCQKFNDKTRSFGVGVPLKVEISVLPEKKFEFHISVIIFKACVNVFLMNRLITLLVLYKLILIKMVFYSQKCDVAALTVVGSLRSFNFKLNTLIV